jgi:hypothetical protein
MAYTESPWTVVVAAENTTWPNRVTRTVEEAEEECTPDGLLRVTMDCGAAAEKYDLATPSHKDCGSGPG